MDTTKSNPVLTAKQQVRLTKMHVRCEAMIVKGWTAAAAYHSTLTSCRDKQVVRAFMAAMVERWLYLTTC